MHRPGRILLAEDNSDDAELTLMALSESGVQQDDVQVAIDGVEALQMISEWAEDPHIPLPRLTLLDLKLPKRSGLEVLQRIRADERTRRMPVIILTSSLEHTDTSAAYDLAVNAYVRKPVDYPSFVEMTRVLTRFWLEMNELPVAERTG